MTQNLVVHIPPVQLIPSWLCDKLCTQEAAHWVTWERWLCKPKPTITYSYNKCCVLVTMKRWRNESCKSICTLSLKLHVYVALPVACVSQSAENTKRNLVCAEHRQKQNNTELLSIRQSSRSVFLLRFHSWSGNPVVIAKGNCLTRHQQTPELTFWILSNSYCLCIFETFNLTTEAVSGCSVKYRTIWSLM